MRLNGPDDVIGVEIARRREALDAGVELDALAQVEGDGQAIIGTVQDSARAGSTLVVPGSNFDQLVVDGTGGIEAGAGGVDGRGEVFRAEPSEQ